MKEFNVDLVYRAEEDHPNIKKPLFPTGNRGVGETTKSFPRSEEKQKGCGQIHFFKQKKEKDIKRERARPHRFCGAMYKAATLKCVLFTLRFYPLCPKFANHFYPKTSYSMLFCTLPTDQI